jgi:2-polyprenyl-6-hydroxyphenyl methylase/3-demethylubiquinone-9 3-methyltransferase
LSATSSWKWKLAQVLELQWWKKYLKNKDRNHYLQWKASYWNNLLFDIEKYIELPEHFMILDAGCGPAGIFICLKRNQVVAIDPLLNSYIENKLLDPGNYPWVQFKQSKIEDLDVKEKFDYIFCLNAINHVKDIEKSYDALVSALKPGGTLIISTDAHKNNFLKKIFQLIPGDMLHPVQLNINEYNAMLTDRNFEIIKNILHKQEKIFDYYITIAKKK